MVGGMETKNTQTTSIGITLWACGQGIEQVWSRGEGDARLIGWERADGQRAIETNGQPVFDGEDGFEEAWSGTPSSRSAQPAFCWRVYQAPEGGGQAYCGEFTTLTAAQAHAETEPEGLWDYQWATARAAGGCDGLVAPPEAGIEDDEPVSWHGATGRFCVVEVEY